MSNEQGTTSAASEASNVTDPGNSLGLSIVLFILLFGLFVAGLWVMSLFTLWTFVGGVSMSILALFLAYEAVPRFLT